MGRREGDTQSDNPAIDLHHLSRLMMGRTFTATKSWATASRPQDIEGPPVPPEADICTGDPYYSRLICPMFIPQ